MPKSKVIIIASEGVTTNLLYNKLVVNHNVISVFIEAGEAKKSIIKRRYKKLGTWTTLGQLLFLTIVLPLIPKKRARIAAIIAGYNLKNSPIPIEKVTHISSIHQPEFEQIIEDLDADLIFINGTRILKKTLLSKITCPIVNIHVGITPKYRGVHGGYWAIRNKEPHLFGVTLHYVDAGIDTGAIIEQKVLTPSKFDNYKSYPILQYCAGLAIFEENASQIIAKKTTPKKAITEESELHYHPTIWEYLF